MMVQIGFTPDIDKSSRHEALRVFALSLSLIFPATLTTFRFNRRRIPSGCFITYASVSAPTDIFTSGSETVGFTVKSPYDGGGYEGVSEYVGF